MSDTTIQMYHPCSEPFSLVYSVSVPILQALNAKILNAERLKQMILPCGSTH